MMTGRRRSNQKNQAEEEDAASMRIPASPMRRVYAAAPPIVKYKKAPQAPKRFKSSYVNGSLCVCVWSGVRFLSD